MEVSFLDLKSREVVNVYDGRKLGRIIDVVFENESGQILGIVVPGDKRIFRRCEDVFIPIEKVKKLDSEVVLVGIPYDERYRRRQLSKPVSRNLRSFENYYSGLSSDVFYRQERENSFNLYNQKYQNLKNNQKANYKKSNSFSNDYEKDFSDNSEYLKMENQKNKNDFSNSKNKNVSHIYFDNSKNSNFQKSFQEKTENENNCQNSKTSFVRLRPLSSNKYK